MKRTAFLAMMSTFLLLMAISVQGQANSGQLDTFGNYANSPNPADQLSGNQNQYPDQNSYMSNAGLQANSGYSSSVPSGAPTPLTPSSPDSLGLQIPTESSSTAASYVSSSGALTPPPEEASQALIPANFATAGQLTDSLQSGQNNYPSQSGMVVSQETKAKNKLYVSLVPQTVAGCELYGWQPMWLQTSELRSPMVLRVVSEWTAERQLPGNIVRRMAEEMVQWRHTGLAHTPVLLKRVEQLHLRLCLWRLRLPGRFGTLLGSSNAKAILLRHIHGNPQVELVRGL